MNRRLAVAAVAGIVCLSAVGGAAVSSAMAPVAHGEALTVAPIRIGTGSEPTGRPTPTPTPSTGADDGTGSTPSPSPTRTATPDPTTTPTPTPTRPWDGKTGAIAVIPVEPHEVGDDNGKGHHKPHPGHDAGTSGGGQTSGSTGPSGSSGTSGGSNGSPGAGNGSSSGDSSNGG
ncbi:hypothetical protein [Galbitalea soli]|uniref:Uncharacterized protein n=1 Tax=Galbitalea soli TaxID=1268042 RepID=A0A7C9PNV6_9MICO|nr:hypothetical protein [Galbitalea soli]NEM91711.1 hypothetical protein [Galbitalea soli]NYJ30407.1 hypothetical protein [Galbitalea soli]